MHIVTSFLIGLLCVTAGDVCTLSDQDSQESQEHLQSTCGRRIPQGNLDEDEELEKKAIEKLILAFGSFKLMAEDEKSWTAIPNDNAPQEIESVLLKCSKGKDELPNACSGLVIIPVSENGGNITTNITYGMGVYSIANFSKSISYIEKEVLGMFSLGHFGWCAARYHLSSGDCLGLNTYPWEVVPPPEAPPLEDPHLKLVAPPVIKAPEGWMTTTTTTSTTTTDWYSDWTDWNRAHPTTQRTRVTNEPTTTNPTNPTYVNTTPAPGGLGAGGVIVIVLILLTLGVGLVLGGRAYFYMQRNRIEEQRALRTPQEIELHANVAWKKEAESHVP